MAPWDQPEATRLGRVSITQLEGQQARLEKGRLNAPPAEHSWKLRPWPSPGAGCKALPDPSEQPTTPWSKERWIPAVPATAHPHSRYNEKCTTRDAMPRSLSSQPTAWNRKNNWINQLHKLGYVAMMNKSKCPSRKLTWWLEDAAGHTDQDSTVPCSISLWTLLGQASLEVARAPGLAAAERWGYLLSGWRSLDSRLFRA